MKLIHTALAAAVLSTGLAQPLAGQSVRELVADMLERQAARMGHVDNYTVVQEVQGIETTQYYEAREQDGRRTFVITGTWMNGSKMGGLEEETGDPFATYAEWMEHATVEGSEEVDGHDTWVILTDDLDAMSGQPMADQGMQRGTVRMYVDKDEYILRRTRFEGTMDDGSGPRDVEMTATMSDYRNVDGVLHPFLVSGEVQGAMDSEEAADMQEQLKEMEAQLASLPEGLRNQVEAQLEQMRAMAMGEGMKFSVVTKDLQVNQGPPAS